jgi:hypothetical protein
VNHTSFPKEDHLPYWASGQQSYEGWLCTAYIKGVCVGVTIGHLNSIRTQEINNVKKSVFSFHYPSHVSVNGDYLFQFWHHIWLHRGTVASNYIINILRGHLLLCGPSLTETSLCCAQLYSREAFNCKYCIPFVKITVFREVTSCSLLKIYRRCNEPAVSVFGILIYRSFRYYFRVRCLQNSGFSRSYTA